MSREDRYNCEEYARTEWGPIVARLNDENQRLRDENKRLKQYESKAMHFDTLINHIKNNELVAGYWNKILMLMKLESNHE